MSSSLQLNNANKTPSSSTRQVINPNPGVHLLCRKKKKKYEKVVEHCNLMSTKLAPRPSRTCTVLWNCGAVLAPLRITSVQIIVAPTQHCTNVGFQTQSLSMSFVLDFCSYISNE